MNRQLAAGLAGLLAVLVVTSARPGAGRRSSRGLVGDLRRGRAGSGTNVTLNDTLGQPIIGPSAGGTATLHAGYWVCAWLRRP